MFFHLGISLAIITSEHKRITSNLVVQMESYIADNQQSDTRYKGNGKPINGADKPAKYSWLINSDSWFPRVIMAL